MLVPKFKDEETVVNYYKEYAVRIWESMIDVLYRNRSLIKHIIGDYDLRAAIMPDVIVKCDIDDTISVSFPQLDESVNESCVSYGMGVTKYTCYSDMDEPVAVFGGSRTTLHLGAIYMMYRELFGDTYVSSAALTFDIALTIAHEFAHHIIVSAKVWEDRFNYQRVHDLLTVDHSENIEMTGRYVPGDLDNEFAADRLATIFLMDYMNGVSDMDEIYTIDIHRAIIYNIIVTASKVARAMTTDEFNKLSNELNNELARYKAYIDNIDQFLDTYDPEEDKICYGEDAYKQIFGEVELIEVETEAEKMVYNYEGLINHDLGTFEISSGNIVVSDPCNPLSLDFNVKTDKAKPGIWHATIVQKDMGEYGIRNAYLLACHDDYLNTDRELVVTVDGDFGVDSGQAGVFDVEHYLENDNAWFDNITEHTINTPNRADVVDHGAVARSGFGDGMYKCRMCTPTEGEDACLIISVVLDFNIANLFNEETEDDEHGNS